jgi:hypothetical protein
MLDMTGASTIARRREEARHRDGQFGEQQHSRPEVALALDSNSYDAIDAAAERRAASERARSEAKKLLSAIQCGAASAVRGRLRPHFDDIVGDTVVDIFTQQARGSATLDPALGVFVARRTAWKYLDPNVPHRDGSARRKLIAWSDEFAQTNGRFPSRKERAAAAERIRLALPAGRRPTLGFEDQLEFVPLDELTADGETTVGDTIPEAVPLSDYATSGSSAVEANESLDDERSSFRPADARKNIWNILAEDGPLVAVKSIDDDRGHRAAVVGAGGVLSTALAWAAGDTPEDDPATDALFAPFGSIPEKSKEEVARILIRHGAYAEKIWDAAMTAALDPQRLRNIKRRESRQRTQELVAA